MDDLERDWPDPDRRHDALIRLAIDVHRHNGTALTSREVRIVEAASHGLTNPAIGDLLGLTTKRVELELQRIRLLLRAKNTTHAVAQALRHGLIT